MPVYNVQSPDGRKFRVEAPEGATQEQVLAYAKANYTPSQQGNAAPSKSKLDSFRRQYPQYNNLPDEQLADALHRKFYGDMPRGEFDQRMSSAAQSENGGQDAILVDLPDGNSAEFPAGTSQEVMHTALQRYQSEQLAKSGGVGPWSRGPKPAGQQSARLSQIETALRAADAAGNTDDARRLAQAYAKERDGASQSGQYSVDQLYGKLERADAAGDTEAATAIADEIRRMQASDPREELNALRRMAQLEARAGKKPDFSNVRGGSQTLQRQRRPVASNAPRLPGDVSWQAPTLEQTNAANRSARSAPGYAAEQVGITASNRRAEFGALPAPLRFAVGAGSRVAGAGRGLSQLGAMAMDAIDPRQPGMDSRYDQAQASEAQARERDSYMVGDTAAGLGGIAGDVGLLVAPGGAIGKLSGVRALAANAGLGAGYAGLQPVIDGESRATNAGVGAAFGAGGHAVASGITALGRGAAQAVPAEVKAMAQRARELGIPLHASQVSQSLPVKVAASAGKYLPFSGYGRAATQQQTAINRAVSKTFGADVTKLTDDAMHAARKKLNAGFEAIYNRNAFPITEKVARRLVQVEREASRRLTNDESQVLRNQVDDILANADDGVLTGQKYQAVRTSLKKAEGGDKLGMAVKELRQTLDDMAAESVGPADAMTLKGLRSKWANFRTVENALKQNAGAGGDIKLAALWPLIRKGSTKEMRELARMGQTVLKDPISDSGTAQRTLAYNLLMGGGSIANPALIPMFAKASLGGLTVGRAANSSTLANLLASPSRGAATTGLGQMLERATPYAAPAGAVRYNEGSR